MKKQLILNEQKLKFYSTNQLRYSDRMRSNFREEISDKDTLVNYILEQLKCNKVDEVSWSCFLQELMACVVIEQVPENFAELKTLFLDKLKELNVMWFGDKFVENKSEEFWVKGILFKADKTLSIRDDNDNIRVIMTNIDYPLMWALIQTTLNIKSNHLF